MNQQGNYIIRISVYFFAGLLSRIVENTPLPPPPPNCVPQGHRFRQVEGGTGSGPAHSQLADCSAANSQTVKY